MDRLSQGACKNDTKILNVQWNHPTLSLLVLKRNTKLFSGLLLFISSSYVGVSWAEVERELTLTFVSKFWNCLPLTKKEVIRNKNKSDLDYPFALPKYIFTALNKCCPWSSTSRFCSFLWDFGKNRAKAHHPRDSYLSVLIFVSFCFFYFLSLRKDVIIAKVFTGKSSSWISIKLQNLCFRWSTILSTENPGASRNTFPVSPAWYMFCVLWIQVYNSTLR